MNGCQLLSDRYQHKVIICFLRVARVFSRNILAQFVVKTGSLNLPVYQFLLRNEIYPLPIL